MAKSEIIYNIKPFGCVVLNADDSFFQLHKKIAKENKIKVISFGIKNQKSDIKLINIKPFGKKFKINIQLNNKKKYFMLSNDFQNNIYNTLAALAVISIYKNIFKLNENIFLNFKIPGGRGDHSVIKLNNKKINLIDQSYNSNPLSLKSAIKNFDKVLFLFLIAFRITFLSEKKIFLFPISCVFSWPFPATNKISPEFKL